MENQTEKLEIVGSVNKREISENLISLKQERIYALDLIRTIAIICVVLCHSTESTILYSRSSFLDGIIAFGLLVLGRLGVPLFLLITGYLCLSKEFKDEKDVFKFYKHNLIPLLLKCILWTCVYHLILTHYFDIEIDTRTFIKNILFIDKQIHMNHMWYMPVIIGIYLFLPFIAHIVKNFNLKTLIIPIIVIVFVYSVVPMLNRHFDMIVDFMFELRFTAGIYGIYVIFGYFIKKGNFFKKVPKYLILLFFFVFYVLVIFEQVYCEKKELNYFLWYDNFFLLFAGLTLFVLMGRLKFKKSKFTQFLQFTSKNSLSVFFIHIIVLNIVIKCTFNLVKNIYLRLIVCFVPVLIISYLIAYLLNIISKVLNKFFILFVFWELKML